MKDLALEFHDKPGVRSVTLLVKGDESCVVLSLFRWPSMARPEVMMCDTHRFAEYDDESPYRTPECQFSPTGFCGGPYEHKRFSRSKENIYGLLPRFCMEFGSRISLEQIVEIEQFLMGDIRPEPLTESNAGL